MYKIFINNRCIELSENYEELDFGTMRVEYENAETFKYAIDVLSFENHISGIRIEHSDEDYLLHLFLKNKKIILAAGGIVVNESGELLIICRNGKWDLPKGKLKKNEDIRQGAVREVEEECGIVNTHIKAGLNPTFHMYKLKKRLVVKKTFWFEMQGKKNQNLIPQLEEGITEVKWFKPEELGVVFQNTYGSIAQVINEFLNKTKK